MEDLSGAGLFDSMFEEDPEAPKLRQLPGVPELLAEYKQKFSEICSQLFEFGLLEHSKRKEEMEKFFTCVFEAVEGNKRDSVKHIQKYEEMKVKVRDYTKGHAKLLLLLKISLLSFSNLWGSK